LVHWKAEEAAERSDRLRALGYEVDDAVPAGRTFFRQLQQDPPDALGIDLSRLPAQGRDLAVHVRKQASTRHVPLVFIGGDPKKVTRIREILPDAAYTTWDEIGPALEGAIAHPPAEPVTFQSAFDVYAGTPLPQKLGIKAGASVVLVDAPPDLAQTLDPLPEGVTLCWEAGPGELTLWFARSQQALQQGLDGILAQAEYGPVWIAWPKKAAKMASDLSQQFVREAGLAVGLVDYKVCSIDKTWSGLLFTKRKPKNP
jgi:hypothetical protein